VGVSVTTPAGVRVINPGNFVMMSSYVAGVVRVQRNDDDGQSDAAILYNLVKEGNIVTINLNEADVRWNTVKNGNIRVTDRDDTPSTFAEVIQNRVKGNIVVRKAASADVKGNRTIGGNIRCVDNILTDAFENEAIGGMVNCSRDPFSPEPEFE
jgi:hypothetical protein